MSSVNCDGTSHSVASDRRQMTRSEVFCGYRSMTVGLSGVLNLVAAGFQSLWITSPESDLGHYLCLWITVATTSVLVTSAELYCRTRAVGPALAREMSLLAVDQFLPCLIVGVLFTLCIYHNTPHVAWMLPGLWSLVFGLGVLASYRHLPRQVFWVGLYFVVCGFACLTWGQQENALSPWQRAISFGGGQLLMAAVPVRTWNDPIAVASGADFGERPMNANLQDGHSCPSGVRRTKVSVLHLCSHLAPA